MLAAHLDHRRVYQTFLFVYPVISRRSKGVSIGINLNPDKVCNFNCVYCEVDRKTPPRVRNVDLAMLESELRALLDLWRSGELFLHEPFSSAPAEWRRLNDIAFSGDGEPTTYPRFDEAVEIAWRVRADLGQADTKLVLITDAACLERPAVRAGIDRMAQGPHEIWAKLDAGTEEFYRTVNRTRVPMQRVIDNIAATAARVPLWIQSLFFRIHGQPTPESEITSYLGQLHGLRQSGAQLLGVQAYTIARPTPEPWATPLSRAELDHIAARIETETDLRVEKSYGPEPAPEPAAPRPRP